MADAHGLERFVAAGNSMGAATALCAALDCSERIAALVLYRVPTIWEERTARTRQLQQKADALGGVARDVLRGAAATNLPPRDDARWGRLRATPILILAHGEDNVHPVSSAEALHALLPHAILHVASNQEAAEAAFPAKLASWLWSLDRMNS